jgi:hypothetical protein
MLSILPKTMPALPDRVWVPEAVVRRCPWGRGSDVGHLYNLVAEVDLRAEADAIHFIPAVSPLR